MKRRELIEKIAASIDAKDGKAFSEFITEDGIFRYANSEPVKGRENIKNYVNEFFKFVKSGKHKIIRLWDHGDTIIWEGEVLYTRHDDKSMNFYFVNIFNMEGDMIREYLIHIDNNALFAE
ncbi:MAG: nuclear transport factor 2 family protein [Bacteroidetes bacterium]|nr:nuclear transport factor 2 family protein [Bacteroidota bacterium]